MDLARSSLRSNIDVGFSGIGLPLYETVPTETEQKVDNYDCAYQDEQSLPDRHNDWWNRGTLDKPPSHRIDNPDANTNKQDE